jgi:hypothetical protein
MAGTDPELLTHDDQWHLAWAVLSGFTVAPVQKKSPDSSDIA